MNYIYVFASAILMMGQVSAQDSTKILKLVAEIKQEVRCCAVPFANDRKLKVTDISFGKNGWVELSYNENRKPEQFNLYELNKSIDAPIGIQLYQTNSFIQFHISAEKTRLIRFASHEKAKEVYEAFMALLKVGMDNFKPGYHLDLDQTVDSINVLLKHYTEYKPWVSLKGNGNAILNLSDSSGFPFNFTELVSSDYLNSFEVRGISLNFYTPGSHVENSWINFNTSKGNVAFIKFGRMDDKVLQQIHCLFIHLSALLCYEEAKP